MAFMQGDCFWSDLFLNTDLFLSGSSLNFDPRDWSSILKHFPPSFSISSFNFWVEGHKKKYPLRIILFKTIALIKTNQEYLLYSLCIKLRTATVCSFLQPFWVFVWDPDNLRWGSCLISVLGILGGTSGKEPACQCRRHKRRGFDPCVGKTPWRRAWQPTPVFLPGASHRQTDSPWGCRELDLPGATKHTCLHLWTSNPWGQVLDLLKCIQ